MTYGDRVRRGRITGSVFLPLLVGISVVSCTSPAAVETRPSSTASVSAVFHSKQDALLAARQSYVQYLTASDNISDRGGKGYSSLKDLVSADAYKREAASYRALMQERLRVEGKSKLLAFKIQDIDRNAGTISSYACVDVASTRVFNSEGKDVTPKKRTPRTTLRPTFSLREGRLILESNSTWSGASIC